MKEGVIVSRYLDGRHLHAIEFDAQTKTEKAQQLAKKSSTKLKQSSADSKESNQRWLSRRLAGENE